MTTATTRPDPGQAQTGQPHSRIPRPRTTSSNGSAPPPPPPRSTAAARSPSRALSSWPTQQQQQQPDQHAESTVARRQSVPIHSRTRPQPPLIERRLSNPAADSSSLASSSTTANANANKRRALSLSIFIPPTSSSNRPPAPVPVDAASATRPAAATRGGHSRTASRESAASSSFASTPRDPARSPQRVRQPRTGPDSAIGRRCSAPVGGGPHSASSPASASPSPFNRPPRTPYPFPRTRLPALERTLSESTMATYTSFDLQHPKTPEEEREAAVRDDRRRWWWDPRRWWLGSSSYPEDEDRDDDERTALLAAQSLSSSRRPQPEEDLENQLVAPPSRQTRFEYVWGEIKCYAKVSRAPSIGVLEDARSFSLTTLSLDTAHAPSDLCLCGPRPRHCLARVPARDSPHRASAQAAVRRFPGFRSRLDFLTEDVDRTCNSSSCRYLLQRLHDMRSVGNMGDKERPAGGQRTKSFFGWDDPPAPGPSCSCW